MAGETKERILQNALIMFAENGYKGTNLRDLAQSLNLSKSALYRHFESKEQIWNTLIGRIESYYNARFGSAENMPEIPKSLEEFSALVHKMLDFTLNDRDVIMIRKLLSSEQFHEEHAKQMATKHFFTGLQDLFKPIFSGMIQSGLWMDEDAEMLAFCFTTPISALVLLSDREPERASEIRNRIDAFIAHFIKTYGRN